MEAIEQVAIEKFPVVKQMFTSKEEFSAYVHSQKLAFEKMILYSAEKFRQFSLVATGSQVPCVTSLGRELQYLCVEKNLKQQIQASIKEMETKEIIRKMVVLFDKQKPELNDMLETLSSTDRQLCYVVLADNFRDNDLNWETIDLDSALYPNGFQLRQDIKLFISLCNIINNITNSNLRDLLKQIIIFTKKSWNDMSVLVRRKEEVLMQVSTLIKKLNDKNPLILSTWLSPLLRATENLPNCIEKLSSSLQVLDEYENCPTYSSNIAVLKQIELIQREPVFSKNLLQFVMEQTVFSTP
ncbi:MAG: hypothetical protein H0T62_00150 [Parachlamydiaceae bacterium]|nr:hypothetical protein [Parachlamydiaceae bacterium]